MPPEITAAPKRFRAFKNWISAAGLIVAVGSMFAFLLLFAIDLFAHHGNPYMGILAYVVAPGFFFFGSGLALLGAWLTRRHWRQAGEPVVPGKLVIDLSRSRDKKVMVGFVVGAVGFLLLTAIGSNRTYHYTESTQFCGQTCHAPMKPEFTAYLDSPHARVACVECHVGPGAKWYVKSKINGVHQLYCTLTGKIERPIKTPVKNLRPAQDTCEQCHWPQKFSGNLDRTFTHFLADETNTQFTVRMLLKVGGADSAHGLAGGIHWHVGQSNKVEYAAADEQRLTIPWVRLTDAQGQVTEFVTADYKPGANPPGKSGSPHGSGIRTMDCMDCHNRPAHHFRSPNAAVDQALAAGLIGKDVPWAKSNLVAVLTGKYATESEAIEKISASLRRTYTNYAKIDSLVAQAQQLYQRNFFPEMKADWRAYPDHSGHKDWNGCFRCHDGQHKTADGKRTLGASDCNSCHTILAQGSGPKPEQIDAKGLKFFHIDSINLDPTCANCHTGAFPKE
jgi:hypothetical protein